MTREGLIWADDLSLRRLVVASDCKRVTATYTEAQWQLCRHDPRNHSSLKDFIDASFLHERISSNTEPYNIAHYALSLDLGRHVWLLEPRDQITIPINIDQEQRATCLKKVPQIDPVSVEIQIGRVSN